MVVPILHHQMAGQGSLVCGQTPDPQIVDCSDAWNIKECVLDGGVANPHRGGFHDDSHRVLEDGDGGGKNQNTEDEGTNRVNNCPVRLEVYDQSSNKYTLKKTFHLWIF